MFAILLLLAAVAAAWFVARPLMIERRREELRSLPFPNAWRQAIDRHVPHVATLPRDLRWQLEMHVQVFVAEKRFIGAHGVEVTDEMRVVIASLACLLWLNRGNNVFPGVRRILIHPTGTAARRARGTVALAWDEVVLGARTRGRNVVVREFVPHLDAQAREQARGFAHKLDLFDSRAADPSGHLARASECFFGNPAQLAESHATLYEELRRLYRVDPAHWAPDRRHAA